MILVEH